MATVAPETFSFQTEVKQLMRLVTHHLYSNKEVFLRELISNSSDAIDKARYEKMSHPERFSDSEFKIWVDIDKVNRTVAIRDNGIGMNRDDVINHLGTIAKSGTREFIEQLTKADRKDSHMIGQFGVGFYSAFVVAQKVVVRTRRAGDNPDQAVEWESDGHGEFTIKNITKDTVGTDVILHLKADEDEFLDDFRLRNIITKYSDHIVVPIVMKREVDVPSDGDDKDKPKETKIEEEVVNRAKALWTLPKSQIKDEEYSELYKHIAHDYEDPLTWAHNKVEGNVDYISLLYLPKRAPYDLFQREHQHGLKLYVKRVFIMDDAEQLLPSYLRFVKGIVDSSDLPLNVSREILQNNKVIEKIKSGCVRRVLDLLEQMVKDKPEDYAAFWKEFGQVIKEGPGEDFANKERIAKLLRFSSTHDDVAEQKVSLEEYVSRMKPDQNKIYYITAESFNACKNSPHLEIFRKKGIEVLLLSDRIDEWLVAHLTEFDSKPLASVTKGDVDFAEDETKKEEKEKLEKDFESVITQMKEVLGEEVKDIRLTHRLTDSPACLVSDENEMSAHLQRMLKASGQDQMGGMFKPIMEINATHPFVTNLQTEADDALFADWTKLLFEQALIAEGGHLEDPGSFVKRMNKLLQG